MKVKCEEIYSQIEVQTRAMHTRQTQGKAQPSPSLCLKKVLQKKYHSCAAEMMTGTVLVPVTNVTKKGTPRHLCGIFIRGSTDLQSEQLQELSWQSPNFTQLQTLPLKSY